MSLPWILAIVGIALSIGLGFRLLLTIAERDIVNEAKDGLALDNRDLRLRVAALERENQAWAEGTTIRRRGVASSKGG